ncbi:MAG: polyphenol oxidoreductase [Ignavibacteria bacterium RBG_16_35_7]|nr:MAG: polyphenol oxidoreductase [Ignavibacteria bacterium RBG_16_35_7]
MLVLKSSLLNRYPEVIFGFSTKIGLKRHHPYFFNMSLSVQDSRENVLQNRRYFFRRLGLTESSVAIQKQIHGDNIKFIDDGISCGESDAMITDKPNLGLAISSADCPTIFLFDVEKKVIAAVHSGWRGTDKKILLKVLTKLVQDFNSKPNNIVAYIAPSISQKHYEVGEVVASLFDEKYSIKKNPKYLLNLQSINRDIMLKFGLLKKNIQASSLCSHEKEDILHSYRRDGIVSGRAFGVIAMKTKS